MLQPCNPPAAMFSEPRFHVAIFANGEQFGVVGGQTLLHVRAGVSMVDSKCSIGSGLSYLRVLGRVWMRVGRECRLAEYGHLHN